MPYLVLCVGAEDMIAFTCLHDRVATPSIFVPSPERISSQDPLEQWTQRIIPLGLHIASAPKGVEYT